MRITGSGEVARTPCFTVPVSGHYLGIATCEVDDVILAPPAGYGYFTVNLELPSASFFFDVVGPYSVGGPYPRHKLMGSAAVVFLDAGAQLFYSAAKNNVSNDPNFTIDLRVGLVGFADLTLE
jgi:hypothetical protein